MSSSGLETNVTDSSVSGNSSESSTYPYTNNIKTPSELGMSDKGTLSQMSKDIDGLNEYVNLLVSGKSLASKSNGGPLGNKYFEQTGAKCAAIDTCTDSTDTSTCESVDRYIYLNHVPTSGGLIAGAMDDLNVLNPANLINAFSTGTNPLCQNITLQTITNDNIKSSESHYVTLTDIEDAGLVGIDDTNSKKNKKHKNGFRNNTPILLPDDPLAQLYLAGVGILGIFILYRLMEKSR
jgi:hypothetical protein